MVAPRVSRVQCGVPPHCLDRLSALKIPGETPEYQWIDTSEILYRRSALMKLDEPFGLWWRSHMYATDWDLVSRMMAKGAKCVRVKEALGIYYYVPKPEAK